MRKQTLGVRLAAYLAEHRSAVLALRLAPSGDIPSEERQAVHDAFESARSRLKTMVRLGTHALEVEVTSEHGAIETLRRVSTPVRWTAAIEAPEHPFYEEWRSLRQWALEEDLFIHLHIEEHPFLERSSYLVRAFSLK